MFSCEYSEPFRCSFFIEQLRWLLLNYLLVSEKKNKKRKLTERLVSFALIGLLHPPHVQAPEPASMSTTTKAFVCHLFLNFIIAKYLKQEVDDGLSVCVDEHSPCDFSATRDIKIHQCHVIKR